jgi:hypothetical protein
MAQPETLAHAKGGSLVASLAFERMALSFFVPTLESLSGIKDGKIT